MSKTKVIVDDATIRIDVRENVKIYLNDNYQIRVVSAKILPNRK